MATEANSEKRDSDAGFREKLPEDNQFAELAREILDDGGSWQDVYEQVRDTYNVADKAAFEESKTEMPVFEAEVVVPDEKSTSGRRYETLTIDGVEDEEDAWKQAEDMPNVIQVEGVEKTDTVTVV